MQLLSDYDFELPEALIAQQPLATRSASRLLDCSVSPPVDRRITELKELLRPNDLLVFNDTKVIKARLFASKSSGGRVELLVERILDENRLLVQLRASHAPQPGSKLTFGSGAWAHVMGRQKMFYELKLDRPVLDVLESDGQTPLPPYIRHAPEAVDEERYQTVFARVEGAVAAPTAGLHFDEELIDSLQLRGVEIGTLTLHVGAGTFQPVRVEKLAEHTMHAERYTISPLLAEQIGLTRSKGGRVVAVGTTSVRALESAADPDGTVRPCESETALFITPGFRFRVIDALVTNFHLPKSTLLVLVSAFAGRERIRAAYLHAVEQGYRFFSYGDAMFLERA